MTLARNPRLMVAAIVLLTVAALVAIGLTGDDDAAIPFGVTWDGSEGVPSCAYDEAGDSVRARLVITGGELGQKVDIRVTAYADENTSQPVGSTTETVTVTDTARTPVQLTIPVDGTPHRGEDGETACRLQLPE